MAVVEAEFWQQISEHPHDVACRLVYADWLEERGDPRGEFIRLQYAREEVGPGPQADALRRRERKLLRQHQQMWLGRLNRGNAQVKFRGGMIEEVAVSPWAFNHLMDDLERVAPVLQGLRITNANGSMNQAVKRLADSPLAERLRSLDLSSTGINNRHIKVLAQSPRLKRLTSLLLAWNMSIGEDGIRLLSRAGNFSRLEVLDLNGISLRRKAVRMLLESEHLLDLRLLMISGNHERAARRLLRDLQYSFGERLLIC